MSGIIPRMRVLRGIWKVIRWPIGAVALILVALFLYELARYPQRSRDTVAAIHSQKITMADVDGSNLPPEPDAALVDATVEGIDANQNGIRDDVELAIFKKYPNNTKVRAAALQYAKAEQRFLTDVFNKETWKAAAEVDGRANICVADVSPDYKSSMMMTDFVESQVFNTAQRSATRESAFQYITSHGSQDGKPCDV